MLDDQTIKHAAGRLRARDEVDQDWIPALVGMMGGAIRTLESEQADAPLLVADSPGRFLISLPGEPMLSSRGRDWFLALGIAHMDLHWPPKGGWGVDARILYVPRMVKGTASQARMEAAVFAAELLMPTADFVSAMENPDTAAQTLGIEVSMTVLRARSRSMGLEE